MVDATRTPRPFHGGRLARYRAVVWLSTSGEVLNGAQQTGFENYIGAGGGYVGVHAAADTEHDWPWYGDWWRVVRLPPGDQTAKVDLHDRAHPSRPHLPAAWTRTDEWYNFRTNPRVNGQVLAKLDESTYSRRDDGRRPPDRLVPDLRRRPRLVHGRGHTRESYADRVPQPPRRRHRVGRGSGRRRLLGRPSPSRARQTSDEFD